MVDDLDLQHGHTFVHTPLRSLSTQTPEPYSEDKSMRPQAQTHWHMPLDHRTRSRMITANNTRPVRIRDFVFRT
ncbi:hypothetical protein SNOG_13286 [Parastagonospora nodorum SN15]|uniref:Uncharacterized protein n=1 Tax=Phaeosphaeria nodorum (strain SN15 / ATCC MYA-4574 / FGSC 10173) TaxID=321614 RepID=Q0U4M8_PHANO|nr:hypothetical protein SNOG_13286 [Parastagonospora nodorum SN15]EAT79170.1 hypothetical protein SNOG_13286 [Parastagonospora nodorum SN15]